MRTFQAEGTAWAKSRANQAAPSWWERRKVRGGEVHQRPPEGPGGALVRSLDFSSSAVGSTEGVVGRGRPRWISPLRLLRGWVGRWQDWL